MRGFSYDKDRAGQGGHVAEPRARVATASDHELWRKLADAFWAPLPWLLEALFVILLALGDYAGVVTVAVLLGLDVALCVGWERCWRPADRTRLRK